MARIWKFGDNIDTDVITPMEYISSNDPELYAAHAMEPVRPEFGSDVEPGDIVVGGSNFGTGSSRETAPQAFKELDVECVIAESFSRIFFRNAITIGLRVYICPDASERIEEGDDVSVDHGQGAIRNRSKRETYQAEHHPTFVKEIIEAGGLAGYRRDDS